MPGPREAQVSTAGGGGGCHNVCNMVGEGVGLWRGKRVTSCEVLCGVKISRGLSQCLPHGGGGVGLWRGKYE